MCGFPVSLGDAGRWVVEVVWEWADGVEVGMIGLFRRVGGLVWVMPRGVGYGGWEHSPHTGVGAVFELHGVQVQRAGPGRARPAGWFDPASA